jgi:glucosamine-6-phosphate isomerase
VKSGNRNKESITFIPANTTKEPKMKLHICENEKELGLQAGALAWNLMAAARSPLLCPASGDSPTATYRELVRRAKAGPAPDWRLVSLDEWVGLDGSDPGSCRHYIDQELLRPLAIPSDHFFFFNGKAYRPQKECHAAESFIRGEGGIHLGILGVGMNGHAGFNEPGIDPGLGAHVARLDATTVSVGQKYFSEKKELSQGYTLGLSIIMAARHLMIIASGEKKAPIMKAVLQGPASNQVPASLLRDHPEAHFFLDRAAAGLL